jgi:hypothetical protein
LLEREKWFSPAHIRSTPPKTQQSGYRRSKPCLNAVEIRQNFTIFTSATVALWSVTAIGVLVGHTARRAVQPKLLQKVAAIIFALVFLYPRKSSGVRMNWIARIRFFDRPGHFSG